MGALLAASGGRRPAPAGTPKWARRLGEPRPLAPGAARLRCSCAHGSSAPRVTGATQVSATRRPPLATRANNICVPATSGGPSQVRIQRPMARQLSCPVGQVLMDSGARAPNKLDKHGTRETSSSPVARNQEFINWPVGVARAQTSKRNAPGRAIKFANDFAPRSAGLSASARAPSDQMAASSAPTQTSGRALCCARRPAPGQTHPILNCARLPAPEVGQRLTSARPGRAKIEFVHLSRAPRA